MKIRIHNYTNFKIQYLTHILRKIFSFELEKKHMHLIFIMPTQMKKINFFYRNKNYTTDVLSFANMEERDSLGDIFINLSQAKIQSQKYQHSFVREVSFLSVHGYLHLKGYRHNNQCELDKMLIIQETMLEKVKLDITHVRNLKKTK